MQCSDALSRMKREFMTEYVDTNDENLSSEEVTEELVVS